MTDSAGGSGAPGQNRSRNYVIIGVIVVLLLCCCCAIAVAGWFYGDKIVAQFSQTRGLPWLL